MEQARMCVVSNMSRVTYACTYEELEAIVFAPDVLRGASEAQMRSIVALRAGLASFDRMLRFVLLLDMCKKILRGRGDLCALSLHHPLEGFATGPQGQEWPSFLSAAVAPLATVCGSAVVVDDAELNRLAALFPDAERVFSGVDKALAVPTGTPIMPCTATADGERRPWKWIQTAE